MTIDTIKIITDAGLGGMSLALFFKLGKIVADHELRIGALERFGPKNKKRGAKR